MVTVGLPHRLREAAAHADQPEFRAWAEALPERAAATAHRWRLRLGPPFEPGGQCSWVALARTAAGEDPVLKLEWRHHGRTGGRRRRPVRDQPAGVAGLR